MVICLAYGPLVVMVNVLAYGLLVAMVNCLACGFDDSFCVSLSSILVFNFLLFIRRRYLLFSNYFVFVFSCFIQMLVL